MPTANRLAVVLYRRCQTKPGSRDMRKSLIHNKLSTSLRARIATLATAVAIFVALAASPLWAQAPEQPNINPEDELAPSQMKQPMPAAVSEPAATPSPGDATKQPPKGSKEPAKPAAPQTRAAAAKPAPGTVPAKPPRPESFRTMVECAGPFAKDSGMLALAVTYDSRNMIYTHETVQGAQVGVTVLFPKDPRRRLEVWWQNQNRTGTYLIDIADKSIWSGPKGLRLGLTLEQLEKLNKKPFKIKGFDENDVASVADWDGGELASLPGGCHAGVSLHANAKTAATELPNKDEYSSDDPALRALRPTVNEILIGY
jgi:hypothetical protein